jgi:hypothetical protein
MRRLIGGGSLALLLLGSLAAARPDRTAGRRDRDRPLPVAEGRRAGACSGTIRCRASRSPTATRTAAGAWCWSGRACPTSPPAWAISRDGGGRFPTGRAATGSGHRRTRAGQRLCAAGGQHERRSPAASATATVSLSARATARARPDRAGVVSDGHRRTPHRPRRFSRPLRAAAITVVGIALSLFQLYAAGVQPLGLFFQRPIHLGFILVLCFLIYPVTGNRPRGVIGWVIDAPADRLRRPRRLLGARNIDIIANQIFPRDIDVAVGVSRRSSCSRPRAARSGPRHDDHRRGLHRLRLRRQPGRAAVPRRLDARHPEPPRLFARPGGQPDDAGGRGDLRHAAGRGGDLHLRLRPLRRLPRGDRGGQVLHRPRLCRHGPPARRAGQGGGHRLGRHGLDLGLGHRQRGHHRRLHHPADEEAGLPPRAGRRDRGRGLHRRADHAAADGRGRVPDASSRACPTSTSCCLDLPRDPLFRHGLPAGAHRRRASRA